MNKSVVLGMSGGVDSSVAVHLLQQAGYQVIGVHLQMIPERYCSGPQTAVDDAHQVAERFAIPFHVLDLRAEFEARVMRNFVAEYAAGRTPNPCIVCNQQMKFRELARFAQDRHADFIATGHYANIGYAAGEAFLQKGDDRTKDQSYFLCSIDRALLPRVIFPLGHYTKDAVRELAAELGLTVAVKPDSQEVCFIPDNDYKLFLQKAMGVAHFRSGDFVDADGRKLGVHQGIACYTIGQRKGLGIALGYPAYVVALDCARNQVTLGAEPALYHEALLARDLNLLADLPVGEPIAVQAKIRYRAQAEPAVLELAGEQASVRFACAQRAITPGQEVCFYQGERVLGGGRIVQTLA